MLKSRKQVMEVGKEPVVKWVVNQNITRPLFFTDNEFELKNRIQGDVE